MLQATRAYMVTFFLAKLKKSVMGREYKFCKTTWNKRYLFELCLPVTQTSAKMGGEK